MRKARGGQVGVLLLILEDCMEGKPSVGIQRVELYTV